MFGLFTRKKHDDNRAADLFDAALEQSLLPVFYTDYAVPDTLDGRFDALSLHLFLILQSIKDEDEQLSQDLFDVAFRYIEKDLREAGIGDMGVPKHMKRMMTGFNGRVHAYQAALDSNDWDEVLTRNLYGTLEDVPAKALKKMRGYIAANVKSLKTDDLIAGQASFTKA